MIGFALKLALSIPLAIAAPTSAIATSALATTAAVRIPASAAAVEYQVPKNEGWVTDRAKLLSEADERALEARLEAWKQTTGHQISVLTIPSLDGESLEDATLAVARAWGIGSGERSDGALLFVAQADRKMRIEVGDGLEGALTDSVSGRIIRDVIAPQFRSKKFSAGIRAGVEAMIGVVEGGVESVPALQGKRRNAVGVGIMALAFFAMVVLMSVLGRKGGGGGGSGGRRAGFGPLEALLIGNALGGMGGRRGGGFGGGGGGGFSGFGGGGFSGGGASGGW